MLALRLPFALLPSLASGIGIENEHGTGLLDTSCVRRAVAFCLL